MSNVRLHNCVPSQLPSRPEDRSCLRCYKHRQLDQYGSSRSTSLMAPFRSSGGAQSLASHMLRSVQRPSSRLAMTAPWTATINGCMFSGRTPVQSRSPLPRSPIASGSWSGPKVDRCDCAVTGPCWSGVRQWAVYGWRQTTNARDLGLRLWLAHFRTWQLRHPKPGGPIRSRQRGAQWFAVFAKAIFWSAATPSTSGYFAAQRVQPNPSIEGTLSGLRPPSAPHVKR